jgi:hypothetical protein
VFAFWDGDFGGDQGLKMAEGPGSARTRPALYTSPASILTKNIADSEVLNEACLPALYASPAQRNGNDQRTPRAGHAGDSDERGIHRSPLGWSKQEPLVGTPDWANLEDAEVEEVGGKGDPREASYVFDMDSGAEYLLPNPLSRSPPCCHDSSVAVSPPCSPSSSTSKNSGSGQIQAPLPSSTILSTVTAQSPEGLVTVQKQRAAVPYMAGPAGPGHATPAVGPSRRVVGKCAAARLLFAGGGRGIGEGWEMDKNMTGERSECGVTDSARSDLSAAGGHSHTGDPPAHSTLFLALQTLAAADDPASAALAARTARRFLDHGSSILPIDSPSRGPFACRTVSAQASVPGRAALPAQAQPPGLRLQGWPGLQVCEDCAGFPVQASLPPSLFDSLLFWARTGSETVAGGEALLLLDALTARLAGSAGFLRSAAARDSGTVEVRKRRSVCGGRAGGGAARDP